MPEECAILDCCDANPFSYQIIAPINSLGDITPNGCLDSEYDSFIPFTGETPTSWTITDGELPTGLELNSDTGEITGTPTVPGLYAFTATADVPIGNNPQREYTICVVEISPETIPDGEVGTPYTQEFTSTSCAETPKTWSVVSGTLPDGLSLDSSTGILSGTPTTESSYTFTIRLTSGT